MIGESPVNSPRVGRQERSLENWDVATHCATRLPKQRIEIIETDARARVCMCIRVCMCMRASARARGNEVSRREKESVTRSFVGNVGRHCPVRHKFPNRWEMHFSAAHQAVVVRVQVVRRLHRATAADEIREVERALPPFLYGSLHLLSRYSPLSSLSSCHLVYVTRASAWYIPLWDRNGFEVLVASGDNAWDLSESLAVYQVCSIHER